MKKYTIKKRRKKDENAFIPNQAYIDESVEEYIKKGGKITRIITEDCYAKFVSMPTVAGAADDFLRGI